MAYREVTKVETKEVLRQWVGGAGCKRISARLGLVRRYGEPRVEQTCRLALDAQMYDVRRLERMLQTAATSAPITPPSSKPAPARHLRPASQYSLPFNTRDH